MIVYRLTKSKYSHDISGKGSEIAGGRWNSRGVAMIYTSESRALCTTEIAVHTPLGIVPKDFKLVVIDIPDEIKVLELNSKNLPNNWSSIPHANKTQKIGDRFIKDNKHAVLKVPSAVISGDFNYLINTRHKDFYKIRILKTEVFSFDEKYLVSASK